VLLASDPKADQAAAALNVRVGHFSDPENIPGLAHFCEHMLFLGTKKFPQEGELETFLTSNAGQSNAFTGDEETCYFFTVNANALKGALDRYSQFFVDPLFTPSGVEREINAVNSENAKNLNTDSWRIGQLYKTRNNQLHPIAKFGTGNSATLSQIPKELGLDIREELLKFYKTYYSANQMTLAVSGREGESCAHLRKGKTGITTLISSSSSLVERTQRT
jgi:insulysin